MIRPRTYLLLYCLTLVAGYADAVAFFSLGVFTANMTGNTVLLGGAVIGLFGRRLPGDIGVLLPLLSLGFFAVGGATAAYLLRGERGRPLRRTAAVLLVVAALLAATAWLQSTYGARVVAISVAILSAVMGLQSIVAVRAGIEGVSTTFVTGTLVRSIMDLLGNPIETPELRSEGRTNAWVWGCYLVGAAAGALALRDLGGGALWIPAAVVALLPVVV